jgi:hypothetical protein
MPPGKTSWPSARSALLRSAASRPQLPRTASSRTSVRSETPVAAAAVPKIRAQQGHPDLQDPPELMAPQERLAGLVALELTALPAHTKRIPRAAGSAQPAHQARLVLQDLLDPQEPLVPVAPMLPEAATNLAQVHQVPLEIQDLPVNQESPVPPEAQARMALPEKVLQDPRDQPEHLALQDLPDHQAHLLELEPMDPLDPQDLPDPREPMVRTESPVPGVSLGSLAPTPNTAHALTAPLSRTKLGLTWIGHCNPRSDICPHDASNATGDYWPSKVTVAFYITCSVVSLANYLVIRQSTFVVHGDGFATTW